jgi:hypothetical protein
MVRTVSSVQSLLEIAVDEQVPGFRRIRLTCGATLRRTWQRL